MSIISIESTLQNLDRTIDGMEDQVLEMAAQAVQLIAKQAHQFIGNEVKAMQNASPDNRKAYDQALDLSETGENTWTISLQSDWANQLESGFQPAGRDQLLASKKMVSVGSRAGKPWVQITKEGTKGRGASKTIVPGHKFAHVPFDHKPYSGETFRGGGDLAKDLAKIKVLNQATGEMQPFTKTFADNEGRNLIGKVAQLAEVPGWGKNLNNLNKYQEPYANTTQSVYLTFRTVSENSKGWNPRYFGGYQVFPKAEKWAQEQVNEVVKAMFPA